MQKERPLSPHLQVYRPQMTSMLSIMHRGSGIFLALGSPLLVWWLAAIANGEQAYSQWQNFAGHWFIQLLFLAWVFAFFYHLSNGIRHLFWDAGKGFEMQSLYRSGYAVLLSASVLTAITVLLALNGGAA